MTADPRSTRGWGLRLGDELKALDDALLDFEEALFGVNEERWIEAFRQPIAVGRRLVALHVDRVTSTIADDVANLRSLFTRHRIPREDPNLGRLDSLKRLRSAVGNLVSDIDEVLAAATEIGFRPRDPADEPPTSVQFERAGLSSLLAGMDRRLAAIEIALEALRPEGRDGDGRSPLQVRLVDFFVGNLAVEVAIARLEAASRGIVDFVSLARAVDAIAELTRDFVATVRAMRDKVTLSLHKASEAIRVPVVRAARGLRTVIRHVRRTATHSDDGEESPPPMERELEAPDRADPSLLTFLADLFDCPEGIARQILRKGVLRHYPIHSTIVRQGEADSPLFIVVAGLAHSLLYSIEGQMVLLAEHRSGDLVGGMGASSPQEAEVVAVEPVDAFVLENSELKRLAESHGNFGLALSRLLLRQLRGATSRIYERAAVSAAGRVHAELLRLARAGPGYTIRPMPILSELAVRVSTSRETVSRAVSALERRGIIRRDAKELTVLDPFRLEELII